MISFIVSCTPAIARFMKLAGTPSKAHEQECMVSTRNNHLAQGILGMGEGQ
jgi:hypothetical protein